MCSVTGECGVMASRAGRSVASGRQARGGREKGNRADLGGAQREVVVGREGFAFAGEVCRVGGSSGQYNLRE